MFQNCYSLKRIALSKAMMTICSYAFNECRNLEAIEFRGTQLTNIQSSAFYNCWQLREIHIPYSVTSMSQCFFYCYALHDIYMYPLIAPTGTTSIGSFPTGYLIHVPKGSLASYEKQWTGHKGHFVEFEYFKLASSQSKKTTALPVYRENGVCPLWQALSTQNHSRWNRVDMFDLQPKREKALCLQSSARAAVDCSHSPSTRACTVRSGGF